MSSTFPRDCWEKKCQHFKTIDLSVDDLVCYCDLLKVKCDACDERFCYYLCPIDDNKQIKE